MADKSARSVYSEISDSELAQLANLKIIHEEHAHTSIKNAIPKIILEHPNWDLERVFNWCKKFVRTGGRKTMFLSAHTLTIIRKYITNEIIVWHYYQQSRNEKPSKIDDSEL